MFHRDLTPGADYRADPTCTISYIRTALGRHKYGERRMCTYLRALIAGHGFPRPLPTLHRGQVTLDVVADSRWQRAAVDSWIADFLPPDAAAALDREAQRLAAAALDQAATGLGNLRLVSDRT